MSWLQRLISPRVTLRGSRVNVAGEVVITEALEQTYAVCDFDLNSTPADPPAANDAITVQMYDRGTETASTQFWGYVASSNNEDTPHRISVTCRGALSPMETCTNDSGADINFTGDTDGEAVEALLTYCGVDFTSADIQDAGYVLGAREAVKWHKGDRAADLWLELDRVFGMKTLDVGAGRVVRFHYNLAPTSVPVAKRHYRRSDTRLYQLNRLKGDLSQIRNKWRVTGPTLDCGDCQCTVYAERADNNALLGTGVRNMGEPFSSDLIQDTSLAEAIARRLMRWYNRQPVELTIRVQNDPGLRVGHTVSVLDDVYGIDLAEDTVLTVVSLDRRGDAMTLQLVGGEPGEEGSGVSGVEEQCNDTTDAGPDWDDGFTDPGFTEPPFLDPEELAPDELPDEYEEIEPPSPPNTTDRFINCEEEDPSLSTIPEEVSAGEGDTVSWDTLTDTAWRVAAATTGVGVSLTSRAGTAADVDEIRVYSSASRSFTWNTTPGPNSGKTSGNDREIETGGRFTIAGAFMFHKTGEVFVITLDGDGSSEGLDNPTVRFYAVPGRFNDGPGSDGAHDWAIHCNGENQSAQNSDTTAAHSGCWHTTFNCNNGGFMGKDTPFELDTWVEFSVSFDVSSELTRIDVSANDITGYFEEYAAWGGSNANNFPFTVEPCDHTKHRLTMTISGLGVGQTITDPGFRLRVDNVGFGETCEENPDFGVDPSEGEP